MQPMHSNIQTDLQIVSNRRGNGQPLQRLLQPGAAAVMMLRRVAMLDSVGCLYDGSPNQFSGGNRVGTAGGIGKQVGGVLAMFSQRCHYGVPGTEHWGRNARESSPFTLFLRPGRR